MSTSTIPQLTPSQLEAFGRELDAIRARVMADVGERDATYLRRVIKFQRRAELAGRALLFAGWLPPAWLAGTTLLGLSKILDNMEIGHNVMHGQYEFTRDPALDGKTFEWDNACPGTEWRHSHNYLHHTFTNVVGKDRDVGYGQIRISEDQPWEPLHRYQLAYTVALAFVFQWGVAFHDLELENMRAGKPRADFDEALRSVLTKGRRLIARDYLLFPLLAGPGFVPVLLGNLTANVMRNLWAFSVIFCGHFPDGVALFDEASLVNETRGGWYLRQLLGSANLTGGKLMHLMSGNLSHQIEHHLFPDLPAHRYAEIAVEVRAICRRYGLPYNQGPMRTQLTSVFRRIARMARKPAPAPVVAAPVASVTPVETARNSGRAVVRPGTLPRSTRASTHAA